MLLIRITVHDSKMKFLLSSVLRESDIDVRATIQDQGD